MTSMISGGRKNFEVSNKIQLFPDQQLSKRRNFVSDSKCDSRIVWHLDTRVSETFSEYIIVGHSCGAAKEEIDVSLNGNVLTISFEMQIP